MLDSACLAQLPFLGSRYFCGLRSAEGLLRSGSGTTVSSTSAGGLF